MNHAIIFTMKWINPKYFIFIVSVFTLLVGFVVADWYRSALPENHQRYYVGRQACIDCHQEQAMLFHDSHHDRAMDLADEKTVLGDFNDQTIEHYGITSRMYRDGDRFMVETDGLDGQMSQFEVNYVFGFYPLQQYMVEIERPADAKPDEIGRVQVLRISWNSEANHWFYLMPPDVDERLEPDDPLHWTGITQNWNTSCAYCHSTDLKKNFNPLTKQYYTTFSEIDVSCEACHGPGSMHVELANRKSIFWDRNHQFGLAKLKTESNVAQVETCAPCHSRRTPIADGFQPGCNFDDYFRLQNLVHPIYFRDGQVRDENYVFGSFIQSKMFHADVKCSDCHDPHSLKLKHSGNQVCTSCHQHPAGKYDTIAHHFHKPGEPGSQCVDCHMPVTVYMECDPRRDHSFRVPRPDHSLMFGTTNACTACHLDASQIPPAPSGEPRKPIKQYLDMINMAEAGDQAVADAIEKVNQEMQQAIEAWYPADQREPLTEYYHQLAIGQSEISPSDRSSETSTDIESPEGSKQVSALVSLARDMTVPPLFRATAFELLAPQIDQGSLKVAVSATQDISPKVVATALRAIEFELVRRIEQAYAQGRNSPVDTSDDPFSFADLIRTVSDQLDHSSRLVRIEAGRILALLPSANRDSWSTALRQSYQQAVDEYRASLMLDQERAGSHMLLSELAQAMGDLSKAIDHMKMAVSVETEMAGPRANLAGLYEQQAQQLQMQLQSEQINRSADRARMERGLRQIDSLREQITQLRQQEHELLKRDLKRSADLIDTHRLHYRFAMSCYLQQDFDGTEKHLLEAAGQRPDDPVYLLGLATFYHQFEQPQKAIEYINALLLQDPQNPGYRQLKTEILARLSPSTVN